MIIVRHAEQRGRSNAGWLDSHHTFSFANYHDPNHMGFRSLRVINDDLVSASSGFGAHSHRDMEIISYVLSGEMGHKDSMGNGSTIKPGDVQRMSAGSGVTHSEWNHSKTEPVHFLQIWILPDKRAIRPDYEQRSFEPHQLRDQLRLIVSPDGREGSVRINQDANIYSAKLNAEKPVTHELLAGRYGWVQIARGNITLNGTKLKPGDGAAITNETKLEFRALDDAEVLLFDLA